MTGDGETDGGGALDGVRVIELAAIGPVPFAGMMLADQGADVLVIDRPAAAAHFRPPPGTDILSRGKARLVLDLKSPEGRDRLLAALGHADVLIEGMRPGVMEGLDLAPAELMARNPRLIVGRATGWGQDGPLAQAAGHDINYIALSGVLAAIGRSGGAPLPPMNLIADYGGGGMLLAFGILAALLEREKSGEGQVIDAAMMEGAGLLLAAIRGLADAGLWRSERGGNLLDSGAFFYDTYECADGGYLAVGCLEDKFFANFISGLGLEIADFTDRFDPASWDRHRATVAGIIFSRPRDEWVAHFDGADACVSPVLTMDEAPAHPHALAREAYRTADGRIEPAPAPRFSRSGSGRPGGAPPDGEAMLKAWEVESA